jgi:hypothetical protein
MKTIIIIFIAVLFMISCKKEKVSLNLDGGIEISVMDNSGNDLLNPATPNAFVDSEIKIYYLIDGIKKEIYNANYDHPRNFILFEKDGEYRMGLSPNADEKEELPITYIQWKEIDTDTIQCHFSRTSNSVVCDKIWRNGTLVWDNYSTCRCIQIVK